MELSPAAMEAVSQVLDKRLKESRRALSIQLDQLSNKWEERNKSAAKLKRKKERSASTSNSPKPGELHKSDFNKDRKPATSRVKEKAKNDFKTKSCTSTSHTSSKSEFNKLYEPDMSTFKRDYEEALARIKSTCHKTSLLKEKANVANSLYINHSEFSELHEPEMATFLFDCKDSFVSTNPSQELPSVMSEILQENRGINHSEFNELYEPEMTTFTFDYEDTLTSLKAKCDISSMQSDFVLDTLTPEEPVQPSSMILVPQDLERKSVEEAQVSVENKRCKPPERERNQLPSFISFIFPKEVPPDKAYQGIHDTQVSLSCELVYYWNNFTYARVIKQPVLNVEISSIMDLIFSISAKKDTGSFDVCKTLTRTGALMSLNVDQREFVTCDISSSQSDFSLDELILSKPVQPSILEVLSQVYGEKLRTTREWLSPNTIKFKWKEKEVHHNSNIQALANLLGLKTWSYLKQHELEPGGGKSFQLLKRLIKPINPTHSIQVSNSLPRFVSHELKAGSMSLFYPRIIEKKLGLFVGRLKQYSYLNMLKEELDDKGSYLDRNEVPLLVYRYSMTVIMHLFLVEGFAYFAGVKEEPPDLFSITVFARTGIGVDLTKELCQIYVLMKPVLNSRVLPKSFKESYHVVEPHLKCHNNIAQSSILRGEYSLTLFFDDSNLLLFVAGKTDLRSNLSQEGGDDTILVGQKREVSSEPEPEGRIELRRCLKQFIRLLQQVYSSFRAAKSSTHPS